ncbi:MAG: methyltransferase family protein [Promethearchaeota archaeon]
MRPKGFDKFRSKLPFLAGRRIAILPIFFLTAVIVAFTIYIFFDSLPEILQPIGVNEVVLAFCPFFGVLIVGTMGFILVYQMWFWRDRLKAKYGETAYQRVVPFGFWGVIWVITIAFQQFMAFYRFSPTYWTASSLSFLAIPIDTLPGMLAPASFVLKICVSVVLLLIGVLLIVRALQVFGIDYITVVYLYFPEESELQEHEIFSVIRNPTYSGALFIGLAGTFFTFTVLSFMFFAVLLIGFYLHVYLVEERELVQRFGEPYSEYRKQVPAFFARPRNLRKLFRFLFRSSKATAAEGN